MNGRLFSSVEDVSGIKVFRIYSAMQLCILRKKKWQRKNKLLRIWNPAGFKERDIYFTQEKVRIWFDPVGTETRRPLVCSPGGQGSHCSTQLPHRGAGAGRSQPYSRALCCTRCAVPPALLL